MVRLFTKELSLRMNNKLHNQKTSQALSVLASSFSPRAIRRTIGSSHVSRYARGNYTYCAESHVFKGALVLTQES